MIYIYLSQHEIKLLALIKNLLGQYQLSFFSKKHQTNLLKDGKIENVDIVASAIKEAIDLAKPASIKEKNITLILPQSSFFFERLTVPVDLSESATISFIKDKIRLELSVNGDEIFFDYFVAAQNDEKKILFFGISSSLIESLQETVSLLNLSLKSILPETVVYFQLFKKTINSQKKENIFYVNFEKENSFGYLYDNLGLLKKEKFLFGENFKEELKKIILEYKNKETKINRIILAGSLSETIRQDLFTKEIGAWTNPIKKIITNFYQDYLKLFLIDKKDQFVFLDFLPCIGGFIFQKEISNFSLLKNKIIDQKAINLKTKDNKKQELIFFISAFLISFIAISLFSYFSPLEVFKKKKLSSFPSLPTPTPSLKITPTPKIFFNKASLKLKVLNGSGIAGKAGSIKEILKEKGYGEIITGNAENFNFEKTELQVKPSKKEAINLLKKDLADYVELKTIKNLEENSSADIILIIGKDFK